jgi:hypothetical protein
VIAGLGLAVVLRAVGGGHVFQYCTIQPSPWGAKGAPHQTGGSDGRRERRHKATGKVDGVIYDRCGDFEGFLLLTEEGDQRDFCSREAEIASLARFALEQRVKIQACILLTRARKKYAAAETGTPMIAASTSSAT